MSSKEKTDAVSASNIVEYDANKHDISAVTVFQSNRAEVKRVIKVSLKNGQNDLEVKNLPTCLEEDSIRVDGIGNAVIFDVIYHPPAKLDMKDQDETLGSLKTRRVQLQEELAILARQEEVLKDYSKTLSGKDTSSSQLDAFLDVFASRQHVINEAKTKLQEETKKVDEIIAEVKLKYSKDDESVKKRGVRVTIVVLGQGEGDAEISLTYIVENAFWKPQYDLRAVIAKDGKDEKKNAVNLHYRASISQSTGENWNGVELRLSTASPLQGTTIPTLSPYWIGEERPRIQWKGGSRGRRLLALEDDDGPLLTGAPDGIMMKEAAVMSSAFAPMSRSAALIVDEEEDAPPGFFSGMDSVAVEGALSTTFAIPGLSTIPSDSESNMQTHKVSIAEIDLSSVELDWIVVPRHAQSAFLRCTVKNTSQYVLLPGPSNIFMNGNFVAKSTLPHVSPQEFFKCSLGVDPALRVTYHPQSKRTKTAGSILSAKTHTTMFEQRITVKNTRLSVVKSLIVKDQIPIARDAKFKVNLLEPQLLTKQKVAHLKENVGVRWVGTGDANLGNVDVSDGESTLLNAAGKEAESGLLEWNCTVPAGESVDLSLSWEVVAPLGVKWNRQ